MATNSPRSPISGSARKPVFGAHALGPVPSDQQIEVTVRLRSPKRAATHDGYLTREKFAQKYGASPADIAVVEEFARTNKLVVVSADPAQRKMVLSGTSADMCKAFGTKLKDYEFDEGTYRGRTGELAAPKHVAEIIDGVFGLDDRPQAVPKKYGRPLGFAAPRAADATFTPVELARKYNFPPGLDGEGQCIGIIELGGGLRPADIKAYFKKLGLGAPKVKVVSVDHAKNRPSTPESADGEVMLDIEVAGAIAPKATIVVYFAPNTDRGFLDAVTTAVHDNVNQPSVISISWGAAEVRWTAQAMDAFEQAFIDAATMGVTICCASGDNGSTDGEKDGMQHVDFPASAPHALGCGGTRLEIGANGSVIETVWNAGIDSATGGGFSTHFGVPPYQSAMETAPVGRGVPDVAGNADPATGYEIRVDGQDFVFGGTSAVAPLWAGLVALLNQKLTRPVGFLNPLLYGALKGRVTTDITEGNNGEQKAKPGWDACTGWGSPDGQKLLQALSTS